MKLPDSKFDIDQVVYMKQPHGGVSKAKVCAIGIDMSNQKKGEFKFVYLLWESDRRNWAGHHVLAMESNIGATFDEAYYDAHSKLPWDLTDDAKRNKSLVEYFKTHDKLSGKRKD